MILIRHSRAQYCTHIGTVERDARFPVGGSLLEPTEQCRSFCLQLMGNVTMDSVEGRHRDFCWSYLRTQKERERERIRACGREDFNIW